MSARVKWSVVAALAMTSCQSDPPPEAPPYVPPQTPPAEDYRLGVGDVFDVVVYGEPELSHSLVVRPDGRISLPLAEELFVVGLTPGELDQSLTERMALTVVEPKVSIIVREFAAQRVFIGGDVVRSGELPLRGRTSVLQALLQAGGPLPTADTDRVVVLRNAAEGPEVHEVWLEEPLDGTARNPFWLRPYDMVLVPKSTISKVNDFVDQYIRRTIPVNLGAGFNYVYSMSDSSNRTISVNN